MHLTVSELGALFLVLFGVFYWLSIFAKTRALLAFLGAVAIGSGGIVGHLFASISAALVHVGGSLSAWLFGGAIAGIGFIVAGVVFLHDMHPKQGASKRTGWIALLLGATLGAAAAAIPALTHVISAVDSLLSTLTTFINSL
jgi:hypothetical protein